MDPDQLHIPIHLLSRNSYVEQLQQVVQILGTPPNRLLQNARSEIVRLFFSNNVLFA